MYISGFVAGFLVMSIVTAVWTVVLAVRFGLWQEREENNAANRPTKIIIEDCHGNRRVAYEAETIDMRSGEAAVP